jgi:hypothetical protein
LLIIAESGLTSMLADPLPLREDDFSHLYLRVINGYLPDADPVVRSSFRCVLVACVVSVALHALVLAFYWKQGSPQFEQLTSPLLTIQLTLKAQEIIPVEMPSAPSVVAEPAKKSPEISESIPTNNSTRVEPSEPNKSESDRLEAAPIVIQSLTMDELREFNQQKNTAIDAPATGIAANVFNPALRKRLHEEASKPELVSGDRGLKNHIDPSGATIVNLEADVCLRSSVVTKPGEAQNWYRTITPCGGKNESEQITERINQAVNGKLTFE